MVLLDPRKLVVVLLEKLIDKGSMYKIYAFLI